MTGSADSGVKFYGYMDTVEGQFCTSPNTMKNQDIKS